MRYFYTTGTYKERREDNQGSCSSTTTHNLYKQCVYDILYLYSQGFGMLLMEEAERIAREEHGSSKIAVISGEQEKN